jgi:hypothetical protein
METFFLSATIESLDLRPAAQPFGCLPTEAWWEPPFACMRGKERFSAPGKNLDIDHAL